MNVSVLPRKRSRETHPSDVDDDLSMSAAANAFPGFEALDFLYMPSRNVEEDLAFYRDVLGGEIVFAIEAFGTRVAMVRLSSEEPRLLLAGHLEGEAPVLVFRVADLEAAIGALEARDFEVGTRFGIPHGP